VEKNAINCRYSELTLGIQYPVGTLLSITQRVSSQRTNRVIDKSDVVALTTLDAIFSYNSGPAYYWDSRTG